MPRTPGHRPTETLLPGAAPFVLMRAALAEEIDRREGSCKFDACGVGRLHKSYQPARPDAGITLKTP